MQKRTFYFVIFLALAMAIALRVFDITADLPAYFSGGSQDLTTDSSYLTLYAKTAVQFGTWDLFGFEPWSAFKISVISGVSYLLFLLMGVSRMTAALAGSVLQLVGLILFFIGCAKYLSRQAMLIIAVLFSTCYLLVLYGRVPFSENGLTFLAGATFFVFAYWFETSWGKALVGVLIALTALLGKSFGFLLIGGPALWLLIDDRRNIVKSALWLVLPVGITTLVFTSLFHGESGLFGFIYEYGVGEHGTPHGLSSPLGFFESLISISSTGLHEYSPVLSLIVWVGLLVMLSAATKTDPTDKVLWFMLGWLALWIVALSPFNYHPVRYLFIVTIPMTVILAIMLDRLLRSAYVDRRDWSWWRIVLLLVINWYAVFAIGKGLFVESRAEELMRPLVWKSLPISLAISGLVFLLTRASKRKVVLSLAPAVVISMVALVAATDLWQFGSWFRIRTHMIDDAAHDTAQLLGKGAVVGGQYGPAITSDSEFGSLRLFLRDDMAALREQVRRFPVTHLAVGNSSLEAQISNSDLLKKSPVLTTFWLRDNYVKLLRINHLSGNSEAAKYKPSDFEQAIDLMYAKKFAEAEQVLGRFLRTFPHNKAALIEQYYLVQLVRGPAAAKATIDELYEYYHDDYTVTLLAAIYYKNMAEKTGDRDARERTQRYLDESIRLSGSLADNAREMYQVGLTNDRVVK
jgi:4-amino-4-deoxy-L-arabinose transferase-like glycosyltransferase